MEKCGKPNSFQTMVQCIADSAFSFLTHNQKLPGNAVDPVHPRCYLARAAGTSLPPSPRAVVQGELDSPPAFRPRISMSQGNYVVEKCMDVGGICSGLQSVIDPSNHVSANTFVESNAYNVSSNNNLPHRLQCQSSNPCFKRFILFDNSGGNRRIFLHPALMQELPKFAPNLSGLEQTDHSTVCAGPSCQTLEKHGTEVVWGPCVIPLNVPLPTDCPGLDARLMSYRDTVSAAFATLQRMRTGTSPEFGAPYLADPVHDEGDSSSRVSCAAGSPCSVNAVSGSLHENTEDLDALLSSDDDEVSSTGHSPVDLKPENWSSSSYGSDAGCTSLGKRKRCASPHQSEELSDVSYLATAWEVSTQVLASADNLGVSGKHNSLPLNMMDCTQTNAMSGDGVNPSYQSFTSGLSGSARKARRRKIKKTIKTLRSIIPGGDCLDAAVVLDEAIHYVRSLQHKVQELDVDRSVKVKVARSVKVHM